jgi:hypothetical protein
MKLKKKNQTQTKNPYSETSRLASFARSINSYHSSLSRTILLLFILLLPTQLGKHFFLPFSYLSGVRIDYLAPTLYVTDILAVLLIFLFAREWMRYVLNKTVAMVLLFVLANIVFALSPLVATYKALKLLEVILLGIVFFRQRVLSIREIVVAFTIGAGIELLIAILQFYFKHSLQGIVYFLGERFLTSSLPDIAKVSLMGIEVLRPYATFSHPNSMAGFYLLLYGFILWQKQIPPLLRYIFLTLCSLLIFISFSKFAIITYLCITVMFLIQTKFYRHCIFCFLARIGVLLVVALLFLLSQGDPLSLDKRMTLMRDSITLFLRHPFFGVGLGNYLIAQHTIAIKYPYFFLQPVHNIFLLLFVETGITFGGIVMYLLTRFVITLKNNPATLYVVGILITTGMFDHYWLTLQQNLLLIPVVLGLLKQQKT